MRKRIVAMLLALAMVVSLTACGGDGGSSTSEGSAAGDTSSAAEESGESSAAEEGGEEASSGEITWTSSEEVGDDAPAGETDDRAFKKFDEPVTVTFAQQIDPADTTLADGEDVENNQYTRYLKDTFNIVWEAEWTAGSAADFQQRTSLAIASSDLPDVMVMPNRNYMVKAAQAGLLADLHDVFDSYASKQVKQIMESTEGMAYDNGTYDGVFVGLPNVTVQTDGVYVMFIRQDWLDELNLEVPQTISDVEEVAKAFMESGKSPRYAIAGVGQGQRSYANFLESGSKTQGFDAIYAANDAYPGFFYYDENDELIYGTNTQETRDTLEILARWYNEGLINPELGMSTNGDESAGIKEGTCGITFGPWWYLGYGNGDSYRNDNTADWQAYPLYSDEGEWNIKLPAVGSLYTVMSADASEEVKQAVVIANNSLVRDESIMDTSVAIGWWPVRNTMAAMDECEYEYEAIYKVLKGEATAEDYNIPGSLYKNLYTDILSIPEVISEDYDPNEMLHVTDMDVNTNNGQFNRLTALLIGDRPFATEEPDKEVRSVLYYTIDVFDQYWTQLQDLEDQMVLSVMTGAQDISAFDTYVEQWNSMGGQEILAGIEEFLAEG